MIRFRKKTYDHEWDRLAKLVMRQQPVCAMEGCGKRTQHVDHITPVRIAPQRRLDRTNLHGLCHACHNRITAAYERGSIAGACDAEGQPLDPDHPWAQPSNTEAIAKANAPHRASPHVAARLKARKVRGTG